MLNQQEIIQLSKNKADELVSTYKSLKPEDNLLPQDVINMKFPSKSACAPDESKYLGRLAGEYRIGKNRYLQVYMYDSDHKESIMGIFITDGRIFIGDRCRDLYFARSRAVFNENGTLIYAGSMPDPYSPIDSPWNSTLIKSDSDEPIKEYVNRIWFDDDGQFEKAHMKAGMFYPKIDSLEDLGITDKRYWQIVGKRVIVPGNEEEYSIQIVLMGRQVYEFEEALKIPTITTITRFEESPVGIKTQSISKETYEGLLNGTPAFTPDETDRIFYDFNISRACCRESNPNETRDLANWIERMRNITQRYMDKDKGIEIDSQIPR